MTVVEPLVDLLRPYQFRGKARSFAKLIPAVGTRIVRVYGYEVELDLSEHIQRMIYLGAYERWETQIIRKYLRPGMCFLDVGANVGYFTLLAARAVGSLGRVIAVEPSPYAAGRLAKTLSGNRIDNVRLHQIGLSAEPGELVLYDPLPENYTPTMLGEVGAAGRAVTVRRLDDCLAEWGIDRVDLMKIDVEGYEPAVLEGASASLGAGRIGAILCEFNAYWLTRAGSSASLLRDRILGFGFEDKTGSPWDAAEPVLNRFFVHPTASMGDS